ncbi:MAG TPA: response regulator [Roseateles sp.]|uniref:response regulator n=1 Tax=Roseateles sp. TaxID=1971397 RepID=UPI002ED8D8BC
MRDSLKFLVVDPLAGVQTFARQMLLGYGFAVDNILCCADPDTALIQGLVFKPHFLVTDWFPKSALTGIQLCQRLREEQPSLHLSLLSFDWTPEHQAVAKAHGARFLLRKPFTAEQFRAEMTRSLEALAWKTSGPAQDAKHSTRPLARPMLPPQLVVKPGDQVRFNGGLHVAQHVVHRNGGTVVQLKGQSSFVPLDKLQPA